MVAVVIAGVTTVVVAGAIDPTVGAEAERAPLLSAATLAAVTAPALADLPTLPAVPPGTPTVPAAPVAKQPAAHVPARAARPAPADTTTISGLAANGIPSVALNAYRVAAARMANIDPGCGIAWWLLAGIGREESDHGQFGGAVLHADGISTPPIIGPALDGVGNQYIPAPSNGLQLDGDAKYAHALGPMQFIPSTWALYGADADGDGQADIFDINDAALGAARYLCAAGGNLRTPAGEKRAVFSYNHSDEYVAQVLALAAAYERGVTVTGVPTGITTGPLTPVPVTGALPPANPGPPTARQGAPTPTPTASPSTTPPPSRASGTGTAAAPSTAASSPNGSPDPSASPSGNSPSMPSTSPPPTGSTTPDPVTSDVPTDVPTDLPTDTPSDGSSDSSSSGTCIDDICLP